MRSSSVSAVRPADRVAQIEAELCELPDLIAAAVAAGDVDRATALEGRRRFLPRVLADAQRLAVVDEVRALLAQAAAADEDTGRARAAVRPAEVDFAEAKARLKAARQVFENAENRAGSLRSTAYRLAEEWGIDV
jgi:hypothetical protein